MSTNVSRYVTIRVRVTIDIVIDGSLLTGDHSYTIDDIDRVGITYPYEITHRVASAAGFALARATEGLDWRIDRLL